MMNDEQMVAFDDQESPPNCCNSQQLNISIMRKIKICVGGCEGGGGDRRVNDTLSIKIPPQ